MGANSFTIGREQTQVFDFDQTRFDEVKKNCLTAEANQKWQGIAKVIGMIGLTIAFVTSATTTLTFSVSLGIGLTSVGFFVLSRLLNTNVETAEKRAELAALYFKNKILEDATLPLQDIAAMRNEIENVYPDFVSSYSDPHADAKPIFLINDTHLTHDLIIDLLVAAADKNVILQLLSLEKEVSSFEQFEVSSSAVDVSALICASFLRKLIKRKVKAHPINVNLQLEALAVKYYNPSETRAMKPALVLFEDKIVIRSYFREMEALGDILNIFIGLEIPVELQGRGFRMSYALGLGENDWLTFFKSIQSNLNEKGMTLIDGTGQEFPGDDTIWQNS